MHNEVLVSDLYDIGGSDLQKNKHLTYAHSSSHKPLEKEFREHARTEKLPNRTKFLTAVKEGNVDDMVKYGKRVGDKFVYKTIGRIGPRHPVTQVLTKVLPLISGTAVGKTAAAISGIATSADLLRMAKGLSEEDKYFG